MSTFDSNCDPHRVRALHIFAPLLVTLAAAAQTPEHSQARPRLPSISQARRCMGTHIFYACVGQRTLSKSISNVGLVEEASLTIYANESKCIKEPCLTVVEVRR